MSWAMILEAEGFSFTQGRFCSILRLNVLVLCMSFLSALMASHFTHLHVVAMNELLF